MFYETARNDHGLPRNPFKACVAPRPIGWISTWSEDDVPNLAPYSYFGAVSSSPLLVSVSIGHRRQGFKDTLVNVRSRSAFCANVVSEDFLEAMNASSAEVGPAVDEFALTGLEAASSERVDAPYVVGAPAVLECVVRKEVDLDGALNTLVIGEVMGVRIDEAMTFREGTMSLDPDLLRPVGRLAGGSYALPGAVKWLPRPEVT